MKILCTCPGRHGDILWCLPSLRALYESTGAEIDLAVSAKYAGVVGLVGAQPYVHAAFSIPSWVVQETAPMTPVEPPIIPTGYDQVFHLGYRAWPLGSLAHDHFRLLMEQLSAAGWSYAALSLDLARPWLQRYTWVTSRPLVAVAFTDEWLELKAGVLLALANRFRHVRFQLLVQWEHSRWFHEYGSDDVWLPNVAVCPCDLENAAHLMSAATTVLACNSVGHIIACGLGIPVVMLEPATARHHPVFYPHGKTGPQVTLVIGNDGQPTFDARHVGDALAVKLRGGPGA